MAGPCRVGIPEGLGHRFQVRQIFSLLRPAESSILASSLVVPIRFLLCGIVFVILVGQTRMKPSLGEFFVYSADLKVIPSPIPSSFEFPAIRSAVRAAISVYSSRCPGCRGSVSVRAPEHLMLLHLPFNDRNFDRIHEIDLFRRHYNE